MGPPTKPTNAELPILRVLWQNGPSTVRQVLDALPGRETTGYTTVLKLLQIMTEKGLVARDVAARSHVYRAGVTEEETLRQLVGDLVERAFGGSAMKLVLHALSGRPASRDELEQVRALIERREAERDGD